MKLNEKNVPLWIVLLLGAGFILSAALAARQTYKLAVLRGQVMASEKDGIPPRLR